jgi:CRP-like cAMP-binding protein
MKASISEFLSKARLFEVLSDETVSSLAGRAEWHDLSADTVIFYQGDEAERVYVIISGEVTIETVSTEGRVVSIASLEKGDVFGEMAVLDCGQRSANVRTLRPTKLMSLTSATFLALISENSEFAMQIIQDLVRRLRNTDMQIEAITLLPLRSRLASLLLDLNRMYGSQITITQSDLAERLSATREKVNVNLQTLREMGAVSLGRGKIGILSRDLLESIVR